MVSQVVLGQSRSTPMGLGSLCFSPHGKCLRSGQLSWSGPCNDCAFGDARAWLQLWPWSLLTLPQLASPRGHGPLQPPHHTLLILVTLNGRLSVSLVHGPFPSVRDVSDLRFHACEFSSSPDAKCVGYSPVQLRYRPSGVITDPRVKGPQCCQRGWFSRLLGRAGQCASCGFHRLNKPPVFCFSIVPTAPLRKTNLFGQHMLLFRRDDSRAGPFPR